MISFQKNHKIRKDTMNDVLDTIQQYTKFCLIEAP